MGARAALGGGRGRTRARRPRVARASMPPGVHYDGERLTPELLERQIRSYYAMRELIEEWNLDFSGIKGQPELTEPLRHDGRHRGVPQRPLRLGRPQGAARLRDRGRHGRGADDADAQASLATRPVLFADVRHYHADAASGTSATPASTPPGSPRAATTRPRTCATSTSTPRSSTSPPAARRCTTSPRRATFTFARLTRLDGALPDAGAARRVRALRRRDERAADAAQSTYVWPHAFATLRRGRGRDPLPLRLQPHPRRSRATTSSDAARASADSWTCDYDGVRRARRERATPRDRHRHLSAPRASLARPDGEVVAHGGARPHEVSLPRPGWAEHDAEERVVGATSSRSAASSCPDGPTTVSPRSCISGIGPCLVPADEARRPLRPAILYGIDTRAEREIEELTERYGARRDPRALRLGAVDPGASAPSSSGCGATSPRSGSRRARWLHGELVRRRAADRRVRARPPLGEPVRPALRPRASRRWIAEWARGRSCPGCRCRARCGRPRWSGTVTAAGAEATGHPGRHAGRRRARSTPGRRRASVGVRRTRRSDAHVRHDDVPDRGAERAARAHPGCGRTTGVDRRARSPWRPGMATSGSPHRLAARSGRRATTRS